ncbi:MAG: caspase family protein [Granulosicoccus sp.]
MSLTSACTTTPKLGNVYPDVHAQDLLVVDCLLPPQVRQLGTHLTYLGQRRAVRTSGADCAIRGGEYVAYNRADFKSALAVWLPLAKQGDPEAQTYVGEIHEQGRGTRQSHEIAARWYQLASNQNYSRAQINLGYLYESGLGVERDLTKALNLYRQASGFTAAELELVSSAEIADRVAADIQHQGLQAEVKLLQSEIAAGRQQLQTQAAQLRESKSAVRNLQKSLSNRQTPADKGPDSLSLQQQLHEHNVKLNEFQTQLLAAVNQKQTLQDQLTQQNVKSEQLQDQLSTTQARLNQSKLDLEADSRIINELENQRRIHENNAETSTDALAKAKDYATALALEIASLEAKNKQQIDRYSAQIVKVKNAKTVLATQIAEYETTITEVERKRRREVTDYHSQLMEKDSQLEQTRFEKNELESQYNAQRASDIQTLRTLQQDIVSRERDITRQATLISDLQRNLANKSVPESTTRSAEPFVSNHLVKSRVPVGSVEFGNYHALIIGNDSYTSLKKLKTAGNDAIAVEQILREKYGFRTVLLLDANQKTILSALERLRASLSSQDNLVIYYAGHGELDRKSGRGYWLPIDSEPDSRKKWIANGAVTAMIDTMHAKHVLVIADSCYSGNLTRSSIARPLSGVSAELRLKWLRAISQSRVRTALSSGGTRPVLDSSGTSNHSIFATYFLDALERNMEIVETYTLFFELQQKVATASAHLNLEQVPQYAPIRHAGHQAGEFIFVPIAQSTVGATSDKESTSGNSVRPVSNEN